MNQDVFAEWLRRQGYHVVRTSSSYWYEVSARVYQAFPYHWIIEPTQDELSRFMRHNRVVGLRYSTPIQASTGCVSYHVVYEEANYTLDSLDRRSRQNVRKGLKNCRVEPISFESLAEDGWLLERDTQDRQGRQVKQSKESWRRRCIAAGELQGFEAWGALVGDRVAATLLTFQTGDCCEMISQQCHRDFLRDRVNNALTFTVTQTMLERPGIQSIFYALHSLDAPDTVDVYKFRMGYVAKPLRQRVAFNPWLSPLANGLSHKVLKQLLHRDPGNHQLAKAEGILRFHLQGKRPIGEQEWPDCLKNHKEVLLNNKSNAADIPDNRIKMQIKT